MITKELGKIEHVSFGIGGRDDCMFGITITLASGGSKVMHFNGFWDYNRIECTAYTEWTEQYRDERFSKMTKYISNLLNDAKATTVEQLKDTSVEMEFDGNRLKGFRILTEVL
jgi:hypothetical protein